MKVETRWEKERRARRRDPGVAANNTAAVAVFSVQAIALKCSVRFFITSSVSVVI